MVDWVGKRRQFKKEQVEVEPEDEFQMLMRQLMEDHGKTAKNLQDQIDKENQDDEDSSFGPTSGPTSGRTSGPS